MIQFFRNIRQSLVAKRNLKRYLLYAFGEIMLVMVGILLALQVNDWNTDRQNRILEKYYLERIVDNLRADIAEMEKTVNRAYVQISIAIAILDKMGVESQEYVKVLNPGSQAFAMAALDRFPADSRLDPFGIEHSRLWAGQTVDLTLSTFNELLYNGQLEVISDLEIREKIIDHYQVNLAMVDIQQHAMDARSNHQSYLRSHNIPARHDMSYEQFMSNIDDQKQYEVILKNLVWGVSFGLSTYRLATFENTQEMIKLIEDHLEEF